MENVQVCFENSWPGEFSRYRNVDDSKTRVGAGEEINFDGDDLDIFADSEDTCALEAVKDFCWGIRLEDVQSGTGTAGHRRSGWLDDRNSSPDLGRSGQARRYENPLTATALYQVLKRARFNHEDLPDAVRRLIYITDLDPAYIHAIVATASWHQTEGLRNAIYKHLAFQTSIAVKIPSAGFVSFQLDLHLPFFLLRRSMPPAESVRKINTKPRREWTDLPFLKLHTSESQGQEPKEVWGIYEAHISCVITGSDDSRWVAYGFVDSEIDGLLTDSSEGDLSRDQISAEKLEANLPIWKPRDYWLKVFEIRIEQVRKEWEYLIHKVKPSVTQYMKEHPFTLSRRSGTAEMKEAFDWASQTINLLSRLDGVLSDMIEEWKSFTSSDGDIGYFRGTNLAAISLPASRSLRDIKAAFRQLQGYQRKITQVNERCSKFSKALELRLILENKEAVDQNGNTAEFSVSILYPIGLAAAIFSMQQEVIPFDPNPKSFALVAFLLIAMIYAARFVIRRAMSHWPLLQKSISLWIKRKELGGSDDESSEETFEAKFPPMTGAASAGIIGDEERGIS